MRTFSDLPGREWEIKEFLSTAVCTSQPTDEDFQHAEAFLLKVNGKWFYICVVLFKLLGVKGLYGSSDTSETHIHTALPSSGSN